MPTYQYACTECGEQLEAVQKFTDDPLAVCPVCQGKLRKLFSAVGIVFKGSGFYRTDSRDGAGSSAAGARKKVNGDSGASPSGESAGASGSGSGSESKPAAKSEPAGSGSAPSGAKVA